MIVSVVLVIVLIQKNYQSDSSNYKPQFVLLALIILETLSFIHSLGKNEISYKNEKFVRNYIFSIVRINFKI
jgi:hypothetical protein